MNLIADLIFYSQSSLAYDKFKRNVSLIFNNDLQIQNKITPLFPLNNSTKITKENFKSLILNNKDNLYLQIFPIKTKSILCKCGENEQNLNKDLITKSNSVKKFILF
jgi:hypothetical protein